MTPSPFKHQTLPKFHEREFLVDQLPLATDYYRMKEYNRDNRKCLIFI